MTSSSVERLFLSASSKYKRVIVVRIFSTFHVICSKSKGKNSNSFRLTILSSFSNRKMIRQTVRFLEQLLVYKPRCYAILCYIKYCGGEIATTSFAQCDKVARYLSWP